MDPYIEACGLWEDFHSDLIAEIKRALARTVPDRYLVRTGERYYLVLAGIDEKESHVFVPDVTLSALPTMEPGPEQGGTTTTMEVVTETAPVTMRAFVEEDYRENFIEIYESGPEHRLVTCIEVLSPSNKRSGSTGREVYLRKRRGLLVDQVNLVEIDLLRGGQRMPMLDPWPDSPYTLLVARYKYVTRCLVWKAYFLRPLPTIKIPLESPDPDIPLDLQPMIEAIYAQSRYDHSIDYSKALTPALNPEETAWLDQQIHPQNKQGE